MNRHIKKYYFYFLARCLSLLGFYDRSLPYYSKVIQFRTFFFDVQKQYQFAYQKSSHTCDLEVHGGVGDFLQHLPFMVEHPNENYIVVTHFPKARDFFQAFNVRVKNIFFYKNGDQHRLIKSQLRKSSQSFLCPREIFFKENLFKEIKPPHFKRKPVIGFQMSTSNQTGGALDKEFVLKIIQTLLDKKMTVILFGLKHELKTLQLKTNPHLLNASHPNIIANLALVKFCDFFIGAESVFKTMSSMSKIPTLVYHADNNNHFRDRVFINPYFKEGLMTVYKYKALNKEIDAAIDFAINTIRKLKLKV